MASPHLVVALAALLVATASPAAATGARSPTPDAEALRLSGVVTVGGEPRLAVIELSGAGGLMVRSGDSLPGGNRVLAIGLDWVRLSWDGEERLLRLTSAPADALRDLTPQTATRPATRPTPEAVGSEAVEEGVLPKTDVLTLDPALEEIVAGVAANETNSAEVLASAIGAYFGLPANTEIAVTDMSFGAFANAAAAKAALDGSGMLRVRIGEEGEQMRMLYLRTPLPEGPPESAETE
jgi:hypothetical protein